MFSNSCIARPRSARSAGSGSFQLRLSFLDRVLQLWFPGRRVERCRDVVRHATRSCCCSGNIEYAINEVITYLWADYVEWAERGADDHSHIGYSLRLLDQWAQHHQNESIE